MMKKIIFALIGVFVANVSAFAVEDVPPERILEFSVDVMERVSNEFFPDKVKDYKEQTKQVIYKDENGELSYGDFTFGGKINAVYGYLLMRASDDTKPLSEGECGGCISGTDIVDACLAAGKIRAKSIDLEECMRFYQALCDAQKIEAQWDFMRCPISGNRTNDLNNGKDHYVGEFCSSSYIESGSVVLAKYSGNYICTCQPYSCKKDKETGRRYKLTDKYQCDNKIDENNNCLPSAFSKTAVENFKLTSSDFKQVLKVESLDKGEVQEINPLKSPYERYAMLNTLLSADEKALHICVDNKPSNCNVYAAFAEDVGHGQYKPVCNPSDSELSVHRQKLEQIFAEIRAYIGFNENLTEEKSFTEVCVPVGAPKNYPKNHYCVEAFEWYRVQPLEASRLAKEYALVKFGDDIDCDDKNIRTMSNRVGEGITSDDYLKCMSKAKPHYENGKWIDKKYYEFRFDALNASVDSVIYSNFAQGLCEIVHGGKFYDKTLSYRSPMYKNYDNRMQGKKPDDYADYVCQMTAQNCGNLEKSLKRYNRDLYTNFGYYKALYTQGNGCLMLVKKGGVVYRDYKTQWDLYNDFEVKNPLTGLSDLSNNFICHKADHNDLRNTSSVKEGLKKYIRTLYNVDVTDFECDDGTSQYDGTPPYCCNPVPVPGTGEEICVDKDTVKSCYVGKKRIDFVLDDLSEWSDSFVAASDSAFTCVVDGKEILVNLGESIDAVNRGKECNGLTQEMCTELSKGLKDRGLKGAYWDDSIKMCVLEDIENYAVQEFVKGFVIDLGFVVVAAVSGQWYLFGGSLLALAYTTATPVLERAKEEEPYEKYQEFIERAKVADDAFKAKAAIESYKKQFEKNAERMPANLRHEVEGYFLKLTDLLEITDIDFDNEILKLGSTDRDTNPLILNCYTDDISGGDMQEATFKIEKFQMVGAALAFFGSFENPWRVFRSFGGFKNFKSARNAFSIYRKIKNSRTVSLLSFTADEVKNINAGTKAALRRALDRKGFRLIEEGDKWRIESKVYTDEALFRGLRSDFDDDFAKIVRMAQEGELRQEFNFVNILSDDEMRRISDILKKTDKNIQVMRTETGALKIYKAKEHGPIDWKKVAAYLGIPAGVVIGTVLTAKSCSSGDKNCDNKNNTDQSGGGNDNANQSGDSTGQNGGGTDNTGQSGGDNSDIGSSGNGATKNRSDRDTTESNKNAEVTPFQNQ